MPDLQLQVTGVEAVAHAAVPLLAFKLLISNTPAAEEIHTVVLRAQIQLNVTRRRYTQPEQQLLLDLFGEPDRWGQTLRTMLWTHADVVVPGFAQETVVDLQVPCTFDFNVAATKYFHALQNGDLPLIFLFSGTVFYKDSDGLLQAAPISWEKESKYALPAATWQQLIAAYYPNSVWLRLRKDVFERLYQYKVRSGIPTWEQTFERVMDAVEETART